MSGRCEREWAPGDVALRVSPNGPSYVATRVPRCTSTTSSLKDEPHWHFVSKSAHVPQCGTDTLATYRPLVVIDPEDREQRLRLARAILTTSLEPLADWEKELLGGDAKLMRLSETLAAALRGLADSTPPKPEEPQGLGAVVESVSGERWVRSDLDSQSPWRISDGTSFNCPWQSVEAVKVLSEGVTE